MKFLEKVKNMFTEEVEDEDVKVEQIKKEVTHVPIETPKYEEKYEEEIEFKAEKEVSKPIFFDDNDFKDLKLDDSIKEEKEVKEQKEVKQEKEIYGSKIQVQTPTVEKKIFKPTPIISPVYGVLDKNYHKEDIVSKNDIEPISPKQSSIDVIRNKAYGTLEDELENTLFGTNSILFKKTEEEPEIKEVDENLLTDLTDDISKELDALLIKKEKYVDDNKDLDNIKSESDEEKSRLF